MRHARSEALDSLEDLLQALRSHEALTERKRGAFYRKSTAFLHFHEDPAGLVADSSSATPSSASKSLPSRSAASSSISSTPPSPPIPNPGRPPDSGATSSLENAPSSDVRSFPVSAVGEGARGQVLY